MFRIALVGVLVACSVGAVGAIDRPGRAKAKVEFKWLENRPIKGVTEEKGFQTTCGPELSYAHKAAVLTNKDVAGTTLHHHDLSRSGLSAENYMVEFHLTDEARRKLVAEAGDAKYRELAVFVDGNYWGARFFRKADADKFVPGAGLFPSKAEAERVVEACK